MIDHLVYAVPDLHTGIARLAERLGVRAAPGGKHLGLGTHNALLALGGGAYLEIIAADPTQPSPNRALPFGLDTLAQPRLVTWAVKAANIESRVQKARAAGYDPGNVVTLSRQRPDGTRLEWRLTLPPQGVGDGLIPFLIDWGNTPHPSESVPRGCILLGLRGEHPLPASIRVMLRALEVDLPLAEGPVAALVATIQTPKGQVELG